MRATVYRSYKKKAAPADIYLFKVYNGSTITMYEICLKLAIIHHSDVIDVVLVSQLNIFHTLF